MTYPADNDTDARDFLPNVVNQEVHVPGHYAATAAGLQAAIDTGKNVNIGPATIALGTTSLTLATSGQRISGAGRELTTLTYTGSGAVIKNSNSSSLLSRVTVERMTINITGAGSGARGLELDNVGKGTFRDILINGINNAVTGIKLIGGSTKSTYFNVFDNIDIIANTACVDLGDQCNANRFINGVWEGTGYSLKAQPVTDDIGTGEFIGVAMQSTGADMVHLGGGGASVTDLHFLGCRLEPGSASNFTNATASGNASRTLFLGGSMSSDVTWVATVADGHVVISPSSSLFQWDHVNQSDAKKTIDLRGSGVGITLGTDTNIYRPSANILKTDDSFQSASSIQASNGGATALTISGDTVQASGSNTNQEIYARAKGTGAFQVNMHNSSGTGGLVVGNGAVSAAQVFRIDSSGHITELSNAAITVRAGAGDPEGTVTAIVGSLFLRTDGGANTTLYIKESGSGNTGWVAK